MRVGLIAHAQKPAAVAVVRDIVRELEAAGIPFLLESATARLAGRASDLAEPDLAAACDLLVVMGGDGTILRVVHKIPDANTPIFGINIGSLGFLTCVGPGEVSVAVASIRTRDYIVSDRPLLEVRLERTGGGGETFLALNDAVISRGERSQLVKLRVTVDGDTLTEYNADGLIVATPTGSTAYSLSAGGPVLFPESGALVITPICPHVLTNRSVVISNDSVVGVALAEEGQTVFLTVDGRETCEMAVGDRLILCMGTRRLPLAMLPGRSFSEVLREKLKWSGSNV